LAALAASLSAHFHAIGVLLVIAVGTALLVVTDLDHVFHV